MLCVPFSILCIAKSAGLRDCKTTPLKCCRGTTLSFTIHFHCVQMQSFLASILIIHECKASPIVGVDSQISCQTEYHTGAERETRAEVVVVRGQVMPGQVWTCQIHPKSCSLLLPLTTATHTSPTALFSCKRCFMNTETNSVEDLRIEMDNQRPLGKVARRN